MRFLMDTDHMTILQRRSGLEFIRLSRLVQRHSFSDLGCSVVSFHEQVMGCHGYINRARDQEGVVRGYGMLDRLLSSYSAIPVLPFDSAASDSLESLKSLRVRVATMDLRIAAIAMSRNLIVLTRNLVDFGKVPGLVTENWTA